MKNFGRVSSEPEEILFGEGGPEILIGVCSGTYKVDVHLSKRAQPFWQLMANKSISPSEEWKIYWEKIEVIQDLGSELVEPQVVDETPAVDEPVLMEVKQLMDVN